jgi:hypothetical protein
MISRRWYAAGVLLAILGSTGAAPLPDADAPLTIQTSQADGVTVKVVPRGLRADVASWDFEVTLETHTQPLNQDMMQAARLIDAQGRAHAPFAWEGDPPGGHHRRGVLRFRPLAGKPATVELQIVGIGGSGARIFRWARD